MDIENKESFNDVISSNEKVLVDFWAPWCGPCKQMEPILENIESKRNDVKIAKCNVDNNGMLPAEFNIRSIPTCILFKDGEVFDIVVGSCGEQHLNNIIEKM